jgi:hypothetical protein
MPVTVRPKDIVDALQMQFDELPSFVDLDTGQVETISRDLLGEAEEPAEEDDEEYPEWELAKRIVSTDRFVELPTKFDVNEWEIMQEFSDSVESERIAKDLDAIHGPGAFRNFKSAIRRHRIESAWYEFRDEAVKQIAIDWCEEHLHPLGVSGGE